MCSSHNYAEWNGAGLQNKPFLQSYYPFVYFSVICEISACQKQTPITVLHVVTVQRVTSSFHVVLFVYSIRWETFFLCFENNNVTSSTGQHRSQSVASLPSYLISHLTFPANVFKRQSAENGHFLCHFQTLTDNRL